MSSIEPTPTRTFYVQIGAPDPIAFQYRAGGTGGTLQSFDSSLKFRYTNRNGTVDLTTSSGITLSDVVEDAVTYTNALATVQLTVAQSRLIPAGNFTAYEVQRTVSGREEVIFMGRLVGQGGDNPDA